MSDEGNNRDEDEDEFSGDYITDEEMINNFDSYFANLDGQGQRTDMVPAETSGDLTLTSQTVSPSNMRGESGGGSAGFDESSSNHNRSISSNSEITVDIGVFQAFPEFVEAAAALVASRTTNRSNNTASISYHDFAVPNSPYSSFGYGTGHSSHSLNEESVTFRSQDSYSGMNIDSPAGSQPQSWASIPIQDSGSQLSQNAWQGDYDSYIQNVPTNIQVQQTLNLLDYQDGDNMHM